MQKPGLSLSEEESNYYKAIITVMPKARGAEVSPTATPYSR